jgi:hypothetical protein
MQFYIATRLENHETHNRLRDLLHGGGHRISYDWTTHGAAWPHGRNFVARVAMNECAGVMDADLVIVLLPGGRGTHVELGIALALGLPVLLWSEDPKVFDIGPATCAFYHADNVKRISGPLNNIVAAVKAMTDSPSPKTEPGLNGEVR